MGIRGVLDQKQDPAKCGGFDTARELLEYWKSDQYLSDGVELKHAVWDLRALAEILLLS